MSWWGKIIGGTFGFMLGGPLGAALGAALGHNFDKGMEAPSPFNATQETTQTAFYTATFAVMGHICKADGQVTEDEIELAQNVMQQMDLNADQRRAAIALFNQGKRADFPLEDIMLQLNHELGLKLNLKRMFMEIEIMAAYADGIMHPDERRLLLKVARLIGLSDQQFTQLEQMIHARMGIAAGENGVTSIEDAYSILNVDKTASAAEIKKSYRRLMSQHHPDKLVAKGLPEEMMKIAAQRTHEIKQAYESIKQERGIK